MQYYVIEGIDTSGKTTQCDLIKQNYPCISLSNYVTSEHKDHILLINEPGGTDIGNLVRELLLNNKIEMSDIGSFLLFLTQRAELFNKIRDLPNNIIADRSLISGIAYAPSIDIKEALRLNLFATQGILPQKIVFLELSKDTLKERLKQKALDSIESKGIEYLIETQRYFKTILQYLQTLDISKILQQLKINDSLISKYNKNRPEVLILNAALPKEELHNHICRFFGI